MKEKMLSELLEQLHNIYDEHGDMPVCGETVDHADYGRILVYTIVPHGTLTPSRVILEIEEPNPDYDEFDEELYLQDG